MAPTSARRATTWRLLVLLSAILLLVVAATRTYSIEATWPDDELQRVRGADVHDSATDAAQRPLFFGAGRTSQEEAVAGEAAQALSGHEQDAAFPLTPLEQLHDALETMQSYYFELWLGQWPQAIDWTAAVMATHLSAALHTLTRSLKYILPNGELAVAQGQRIENEISKYFSQVVAYYFGEDAFSIRMQAYDDMLWVVLGWLEGIKFINLHADLHYDPHGSEAAWYGTQFKSSFAHRAHIFYDIASRGWDTELCGGGMTWNPRLTPYKNAITNELYISASIGMYLYFPGDDNASPFMEASNINMDGGLPAARPHDPKYLKAAMDGYRWLKHSNMTNKQGLYVDGFHIRDWGKNGSIGTGKCDVRNEMVYTYNQGVLLSGLRGLWESTGQAWYLEDGHKLVRNVIAATGWHDSHSHQSSSSNENPEQTPDSKTYRPRHHPWRGLGRNGILEEACDASGTCSQNGQTFKGIFFHHLTLFCEPLPAEPLVPGTTYAAPKALRKLHRQSCKEYATWVAHNARHALRTRDEAGRFGEWWGAPRWEWAGAAEVGQASGDDAGTRTTVSVEEEMQAPRLPDGAVDYRNNMSLPLDRRWVPAPANDDGWDAAVQDDGPAVRAESLFVAAKEENLRWVSGVPKGGSESENDNHGPDQDVRVRDLNDRGRGRTVETQGGGVAVVRAMWEFVNMYRA